MHCKKKISHPRHKDIHLTKIPHNDGKDKETQRPRVEPTANARGTTEDAKATCSEDDSV